ncbi:thiamine pyrophosphate-binding protein [Qaidamihabitans albus]|uniref:thiamine pyrophosphate-binding protein n=1 Tax=Qaidamihabitans albus TaxID=2795733 RepID=UPI0018F240CA|nr:thiamine pyrophosphate-binding protein [Qaidamihabitans albus]
MTAATETLQGLDLVAQSLLDNGVRTIFGVMGDGNLAWLSRWASLPGVRYVGARHEAGAVVMADGYAADTGHVGVSTVTYGPGLLNAMNALCTAVRDRWPQLLVTGTTPASKPHHVQRYDHAALVAATGAEYWPLADPASVEATITAAVERCLSGNRVVVLDIATEVLEGSAAEQVPSCAAGHPGPVVGPAADGDQIRAAVDLLRAAARPLVLSGIGVERSGAASHVTRLAEALDAVITTTLPTRGLYAGNPRYAGVFGGFSTPATMRVIEACDVLLVLGAGLNEYTTHGGSLLAGKAVVQVDTDPDALGRQHPVDLGVAEDVRDVLEALLRQLGGETAARPPAPCSWAPEDVAEQGAVLRPHTDESDERGIDPRTAMEWLDRTLSEDRVIVVDGGHFVEWPSRYLRATGPGTFRTGLAGGSIAMAQGIAAGMATNGRREAYVAIVGDGGYFMSMTEIETICRERLPVLVVVVNDGAYAAEIHKLRAAGLPEELAWFHASSDPAAVATAMGARGLCVSTATDLAEASEQLTGGRLDGPVVLDLHVTPRVVSARLANVGNEP